MNSANLSDRERIERAIKRKPGVTIFEMVRILGMQRGSIKQYVVHLLREGSIRIVKLPARPGISEARHGYEFVIKKSEPAPEIEIPPELLKRAPAPARKPAHAIPSQWDPLAFLFGRATVES